MARKTNRVYALKIDQDYALPRCYVALGEYLAKGRAKASLTQREVSQELGYSSAQFISNFERGISSPPLKKLKKLIDLYDLKPNKVMNLVLAAEREILGTELRA